MSYTRDITIWCEGPDCQDWIMVDHVLRRVKDARIEVRTLGWTHRGGRDFCPDHSAPRPEKS